MRTNLKRSALALACVLGMSGVAAAHAAGDDAADENPSRSEAVELERVVATAQKRVENVGEVPMAISVISEDRLETLNAGRLTDYAAYVPGFQVDSGGAPGVTSMSLRGLAPMGGGAIIGTYIDDTPVNPSNNKNRAGSYVLDMLPYDLESVEILRGPQGTLYGASSMGGLFKYITRAADTENHEFRAGMDVSTVSGAGDLGTGVRAAANFPLKEGRLGMRVSVARQTTPGYVDETNLGEKDANGYVQEAARLAFKLNITDNASLRLQGLWQKVDADSLAQVGLDPDTLQPVAGRLDGNAYVMQPYDSEIAYYSAILDVDLGWADLVSATSHVDTRLNIIQDASPVYGVAWPLFGYPAGLSDFNMHLGTRKLTQEIRLTSKTSQRFDWLVGLYYTDETSSNRQVVRAWDMDYNELPISPAGIVGLPNTYEETALFADATWKLSPKFDVSAGVRYARNSQDFTQITTGPLTGDTSVPGTSRENVTTWKLATRWHLGEDSMLYARLATGYRPGGPNLAQPGVPPMTNSDTTRNLELGWKAQFWNRRAMVDMAVFRTTWNDLQVGAVTGTGLNYIANAGSAKSQGVELAFMLRPLAGLTWGVNAAWIDAEIGDDVPPTSTLTPGRKMPGVPEFSWSTTLDYNFDVGERWSGRVGGGYRYTGKREGSIGDYGIPAYDAVDLHAELTNMTWTVRLYARNATNELVYMSASAFRNALTGEVEQVRGTPLVPRTIGLMVDYRF